MKGIHIINDTNGNPAVLTIDLNHLDPTVSPLVSGLLARVGHEIDDAERSDFLYTSGMLANRAYGEDEPDYTDAHLIERNPNYCPK
jgi:hypothetical protein